MRNRAGALLRVFAIKRSDIVGKYSITPKNTVITEEQAIEQFVPFLEFYGINLDKAGEKLTGSGKLGTVTGDEIGDSYIEKICNGDISFEKQDSGEVFIIQHLKDTKGDIQMLQYKTLKGIHRKQLAGSENSVGKSYKFLAQLCGSAGDSTLFFDKMGAHDSLVALEVAGLFQLA